MRQVCTSSAWPPGTSMTLPLSCKARTKVRLLTWRSPHQLTRSLTSCTNNTKLSHHSNVRVGIVTMCMCGCCNYWHVTTLSLHALLETSHNTNHRAHEWTEDAAAQIVTLLQHSTRNSTILTGVKKSMEATRVAGTIPGSSLPQVGMYGRKPAPAWNQQTWLLLYILTQAEWKPHFLTFVLMQQLFISGVTASVRVCDCCGHCHSLYGHKRHTVQ